jgi:hypothetical protein
MRKWIVAAVAMTAVAMTAAAIAQAAELEIAHCRYPEPPMVPDGATATEAEMGQSGADVREYVAGMESSLECLLAVEESMGEEITEEQQATLVAVYNNGIDQMNAIVNEYNAQVKVYRDDE